MTRLMEWEPEQLMFLDESAANERTMDRKYGWAPIGSIAHVSEPFKRTMKWSILPLYTVNGFETWDLVQGLYNREMFNDFIREWVIPLTNPFPGPRSVLIMDNARIHHSEVYLVTRLADLGAHSDVCRCWCRSCIFTTIFA